MIFKRRERRGIGAWIRDVFAPRKGWRRGFRYIGKRVQRLPDTPHRIALGFACGAFASFTPFFTLHAIASALLAWMVRGNILASVFGTIVGNPLSFPFIAAMSLELGNWMLGREDGVRTLDKLSFSYVADHPAEFVDSIFTPYFVGGLGPGLLAALVTYWLLRPMVAGFQKRRRAILTARAKALVTERRAAREAAARAVEAAEARQRAAGLLPFRRRKADPGRDGSADGAPDDDRGQGVA